jgi:AmmeMemoRadiSam system protein A
MARSLSTKAEEPATDRAAGAVEIGGDLGDTEGQALAAYARAAIRAALGGPEAVAPDGAWARAPGATFVTLLRPGGELQGCIGSIEPRRALADDVAANAVAAALDDPRGQPLTLADVDQLIIEVSLLGPLEPIACSTEEEACAALCPRVDGVVLRDGPRRATFLPDVWESLPDPKRFLWHLKRKAGIASDAWRSTFTVYRYSVRRWFDRP